MQGKLKMRNGKVLAIWIPILAVLLALLIALNVLAGIFGGVLDTSLGRGERHTIKPENTETWDTEYYEERYGTLEEAVAASQKVMKQVDDEGTVLLKNNGVLPLKDKTVTPFGRGYAHPIYNGMQEGGSILYTEPEKGVSPAEALEEDGFTIISAAADKQPADMGLTTDGGFGGYIQDDDGSWIQVFKYENYPDAPQRAEGTSRHNTMSFGGDNQIPELKVDVYNDIPSSELEKMKDSAGLVFVSRSGSESLDKKADAYDDGTPHFLALSKNERDMIAYAKEHCGSVILIVNSSNPVELTPVMQGELEVDAIIWAGHPGDQGFRSVADILAGEVNPSGRLVDIFATDFTKTPSYNNWGKFRYTNADKSPFVEYREGMYNGYRYYETAHDIGAAGFVYGELDGQGGVVTPGEVAYPFGYGLSYTTFEQKISSFTAGDTFTVTVDVTNTGDMAGKEVVQLYYTPPYTDVDQDLLIEKPTATLVAFGKTESIAPGETKSVTLTFDKDELASYCYTRDNGDGTTGCYFLEEGEYSFTLRANSHEVIEEKTWKNGGDIWYDNSNPRPSEIEMQAAMADDGTLLPYPERQAEDPDAKFIAATNLFPYMSEYMQEESVMLTRADWNKTLPSARTPDKDVSEKFSSMFNLEDTFDYKTDEKLGNVEGSAVYSESVTEKADKLLTVLDMRGKDYYDEDWEALLDQLDYDADADDIKQILVAESYFTNGVDSIGLPPSRHCEGANGVRLNNGNGLATDDRETSAWCMAPMMASTWNTELIRQAGEAMGQEGLLGGRQGRMAPAFNLHRSPFQGRVFEYYSEDPLLSGKMAVAMVNGTSSMGMFDYIKHFGLNDQETYRDKRLKTWANEQVIRELYNRPFEIAIREARKTIKYTADQEGTVKTKVMRGVSAMMGAQNCFGPVTAFANYDLMTKLVREEWNFNGVIITDMFSGSESFIELTIRAGTDTWLVWQDTNPAVHTDTATGKSLARTALHRLSYTIANSSVLQDSPPGTIIYYDMSPWRVGLLVGTIVGGVAIGAAALWLVIRTVHSIRHPEQYRTKQKKEN